MIIEKKLFYYLNEAIMYMRERERERTDLILNRLKV